MPHNITKKIPERKCMGCNEKHPKKELVRVVRKPDGNVLLDNTGKVSGRGAYICPNLKCLEKALKSKRLDRSLETEVPESIYEQMKNILSEVENNA